MGGGGPYKPPSYCGECGTPFPWTETALEAVREYADDLDQLSQDEITELKKTLDDLTVDVLQTSRRMSCEWRLQKARRKELLLNSPACSFQCEVVGLVPLTPLNSAVQALGSSRLCKLEKSKYGCSRHEYRQFQANDMQPQRLRVVYSSKIIKAGALLPDTKTLLSHWNLAAPIQDNFGRLQRDNVLGKASRSRVEDIIAIFRQRYLGEPSVTRALVRLVKNRFPATALDRILYFHAARADRLIRDVVIEVLLPQQASGVSDVDAEEIERALTKWVKDGRTTKAWGEYTTRRVVQGILSALRDFGVLQGAVNKRIAPAYLPVEAFAYVIFFLKQHQPSGAKLLELPEWKLFFLPREGVERFLFDAHQHGLLQYHAAGSVTRLTFPVKTLEEYADVLAQRAN
jgi:BrxA/Uncharacterized protein conserved in bacteria (DUF2321)